MIKEIKILSTKRNEFIDITDRIESLIKDVKEGTVTIFCPHTTAAITINENADPDVQRDILWKLSQSIPKQDSYKHGEGNSDAHIKSSLIGQSVTVIVVEGKLILGTWQAIFFCEFDGPRERKVIIKIN
jgi:secondary thiamine-phosphate synthase enzyme